MRSLVAADANMLGQELTCPMGLDSKSRSGAGLLYRVAQ